MDAETPVLQCLDVSLRLDAAGTIAPFTLTLPQGGLVLVDLRRAEGRSAFADAIVGLVPPLSGNILFEGRDWREVPPEQAGALRGRIGRLFARDAWLPEIGIDENILLAPLFHTRRTLRALHDEAARLAATFGLPGLPTGRAATLTAEDRHRAGLVRAFLNAPDLVILEEPIAIDGAALLPALMAEVRSVRDRGGAVLWLTAGLPPGLERTLPATDRFRLSHGALQPLGAQAA